MKEPPPAGLATVAITVVMAGRGCNQQGMAAFLLDRQALLDLAHLFGRKLVLE